MSMSTFGLRRAHGITLALTLAAVGCAPVEGDSDSELDADFALYDMEDESGDVTEKAFVTGNGLRTFNGLTRYNGLRTMNGLTTTNGLRYVNGLMLLNGLTTKNGLRTFNGLPVDCSGRRRCTGEPDGLLSRSTGLMRNADGVHVAQYVVRCALSSNQSITVKRWDGRFVTLTGSIGLAPEWLSGNSTDKSGVCDSNCQERVSACLLSLSNASGANIALALTSPLPQVGAETVSSYPYNEGAYFGNLFDSPPRMYIYPGKDYGERAAIRACTLPDTISDAEVFDPGCMFRFVPSSACINVAGTTTALSCTADADGLFDSTARTTWNNVITVWRSTPSVAPTRDLYVEPDNGAFAIPIWSPTSTNAGWWD